MPKKTSDPTQFRINDDILINGEACIVEAFALGGICVRVKEYDKITKDSEIYFKQFNCLTPKGQNSRLYIIPHNELVRQKNEQKGQTTKAPKRKYQRKSAQFA